VRRVVLMLGLVGMAIMRCPVDGAGMNSLDRRHNSMPAHAQVAFDSARIAAKDAVALAKFRQTAFGLFLVGVH
jgi:hypothetical protein